jgi:O-antigen/teichoic acid export membrane protein
MRSRKAFLNILSALVYQIVAIICGLITPRLILFNFGSTYNGVINSATQFLSMINILTLGITGATRVALYKTLSLGDSLGTSRIMKATKMYMRKVGVCIIGYIAILCLVYPYISHNDLSALENAALIAIVGIGIFAQYFFGISNQTLLQADQASYIIYVLDIFKSVINTICVAFLIKIGASIFVVKLGSSIVFLITPIIMEIYVAKKYHLTSKCKPDNTGIKERGSVAFLSIANLVHNNVDLVLLTLFTDAKIISVYTVYYLVVGKIRSLMQICTTGMEAAFGNMWAKGEIKTLKKNFRGFEYMMFTFTAVIFSCVGMLILPFIKRYTSGIVDVEYVRVDLAILVTVAEALYCIRQPYMTLVQATGHYRQTRNGSAVEAVLNLSISLILIQFMGIAGVFIGTVVANTFRTVQYGTYISKNILKRNIIEIVYRFLWTCICIFITCILSYIVQSKIEFSAGWNGWIIEAVIVFFIACLVSLLLSLVFYRKDFLLILNVGKRMIRKR